jgi:hypothetical protein
MHWTTVYAADAEPVDDGYSMLVGVKPKSLHAVNSVIC